MDKQAIEIILNRIDMDIESLVCNLEGDSQNAPTGTLKMSILLSVEHLKVNRRRIQEIKDLLNAN